MRKITNFLVLVSLLFGLVLIDSCKKDKSLAVLTTSTVTNITINSATSGGSITSSGGAEVTARGVCWSTSTNPTISDSHTTDGKGSGAFVSNIANLTPDTKYYIKAYATNSVGTAYGNEVSFTTTAIVVPSLTTTAVTSIGLTSAVSGGEITSNGGANVTARGVCWSTSASPTIDDDLTDDGTGTGSFASTLTTLEPGTEYFVRAYATNSVGTGYGNEISFTTTPIGVATLTTTEVTSIALTTAVSGGEITDDGGDDITVRGVCWATTANPVATGPHTTDGSGIGSFASDITALTPGTLYHVRAYATNSAGTAYGNDVTFTTVAIAFPTLTTTAATSITVSSATSGGEITDNGGGTISQKGVCWALTANPVATGSHTSDGPGGGTFTSSITSLQPGTEYHVRAYATNEAGTAYGEDLTFTTVAVVLPTVTTTAASAIAATTAQSGGNVTNAGGGTISARGVAWSTSADPNIDDDPHTSNATGTGSFTSTIINLTGNTTYYVKAYATNQAGTSYGSEVSFTTPAATDADGNNYSSIVIGTQTWLSANLKTTRYSNGDVIGTTTANLSGVYDANYQWPVANNEANVATYGRFYTWAVASDARNVCPTGWHVPTDAEWETLKTFLGGAATAGGALKEVGFTHWTTPNTGATNSSGFTAVAGGYRNFDGAFVSLGISSPYWSSSNNTTALGWGQRLLNSDAAMTRLGFDKPDGCVIRCIR